jgi:hypothetical protein
MKTKLMMASAATAAAALIATPAVAVGLYADAAECEAALLANMNWNANQDFHCAYDAQAGGWVIVKVPPRKKKGR